MEDNQTEPNIAGVREPMTANKHGAAQWNKPLGSLPPWGNEARSHFCSISGRAVGPFWLDWEGRWSLSRVTILPPEENPHGLNSGKGREREENGKKNLCLVSPWHSCLSPPSSLQEGMMVLKKKCICTSLPALVLKAEFSYGDLKEVKAVTVHNWTLSKGFIFAVNQYQPKNGPGRQMGRITFQSSLEPQPNLEWPARVGGGVRCHILWAQRVHLALDLTDQRGAFLQIPSEVEEKQITS